MDPIILVMIAQLYIMGLVQQIVQELKDVMAKNIVMNVKQQGMGLEKNNPTVAWICRVTLIPHGPLACP